MPSRRPSAAHQEAVSRRLALLSAELSQERPAVAADDYALPLTHTRVASGRVRPEPTAPVPEPPPEPLSEPLPEQVPGPVPASLPQPVRRPGRHAARRGRAWLPDALQGRVALGPGPLALVAVIVATGLAVTCWLVVRSDPRPVPAAPSVPVAPLASPVAAAASGSPEGEVTVDVAGKVRRPGIVVLASGSRVVDALEAAGGARPGVDLATLNLARVLVDGEQLVVGIDVPVVPGLPASTVAPSGGPLILVNLNTAGQAELETLPDVGPVTAQAIIAWRTEHGTFRAVEELLEVDGIGDATLATLTPHVTV